MDVDFNVFKPFDDVLHYKAFAGFEGSKHHPVMMGVIASEQNGKWVNELLDIYEDLHFIKKDGSYDMLANTSRMSIAMQAKGCIPNGIEQDYNDLHILPVDFFCPRQTTGEYFKTSNTYCDHIGESSWATKGHKAWIKGLIGQKNMTSLIKLKRKIIG